MEGVNYATEYVNALPHRTPSCGADCHPMCKRSGYTRCPLCSCPLDDWKVCKEYAMAGDVLAARRQAHLNDLRKLNQTYDDIPVIKPHSINRQ